MVATDGLTFIWHQEIYYQPSWWRTTVATKMSWIISQNIIDYENITCTSYKFHTLWPRQNGRCFPDYTFKHIFLNENVRISIEVSLKFVHQSPINNIPALVQIMDWRRPSNGNSSRVNGPL